MKNYLKFWGTRGSCPVSGSEYDAFGGNTCCTELVYDAQRIILDAGTGLRPLGHCLENPFSQKLPLFLSHLHWDHVQGLPYFEPLLSEQAQIHIYAPPQRQPLPQVFAELFRPEFFPVALDQIQAQLSFEEIQLDRIYTQGPLQIQAYPTEHPGLTYGFKIHTPQQTIAYLTDHEAHGTPPPAWIEFFQGCDLLIQEAQYFPQEAEGKPGWGHSSFVEALSFVKAVSPARWLVIHHDPQHTDLELRFLEKAARKAALEQGLDCPIEWIPDGYFLPLL